MKATPVEDLRRPHPDQKQIDAEAVRLLLATAPAGYAKELARLDPRADSLPIGIPAEPPASRR